ncbi:MAG: ABC transporter substrate-binding protein [Fibrobacterota bacterium]
MPSKYFNIFASVFLSLILFGCGGDKVTSYPREKTLYIGGHIWGEPNNFNPLNSWPITWPATANSNLLFETLFGFNINSGQLEPLLGKEWSITDSVLTVTLNEKARWNDGEPVTNEDVLYTFELHRRFWTDHHTSWKYIDSMFVIEETGQIAFKLSAENYNPLVMKDVITSVPILPRHVFKPLEKTARRKVTSQLKKDGVPEEDFDSELENGIFEEMKSFTNTDRPVGSGPYTVYDMSVQKLVLVRVDDYWGNEAMYGGRKPAPKYIIHPVYKSNSAYNLALTQGKLDVSSTFCPMIGTKKDDGVGTWYEDEPFYVPGSIPSLLICHKPDSAREKDGTYREGWTKDVLKDAAFRRACDISINREVIRRVAIYNYAPQLRPGYIIDHDLRSGNLEGKYFNEKDAREYGSHYYLDSVEEFAEENIPKARKILEEAGYTWSDTLMIAPSGDTVAPLKIACPSGWSDWETAVEISVQGMREAGIPVRQEFIQEGTYWERLAYGHFDFIVKTPQAAQVPSLPWSRFDKAMSGNEMVPMGSWASGNEGRYQNDRVDSLLSLIPQTQSDSARVEAYRELNKIFMQEVPVIPLMYRPSVFYQFNTTVWSGFPRYSDGKGLSPQNLNVGAAVKGLWELKLNKKKN